MKQEKGLEQENGSPENGQPDGKVDESSNLMPSWFTEKMMNIAWDYGLMMTNGKILCVDLIERIERCSDGEIWLYVRMHDEKSYGGNWDDRVFLVPSKLKKAIIRASQVMFAFELTEGSIIQPDGTEKRKE